MKIIIMSDSKFSEISKYSLVISSGFLFIQLKIKIIYNWQIKEIVCFYIDID